MEAGVKELQELLIGVNELAVLMVEVLKDGIDFSDAMKLWDKFQSDPLFKDKLEAAYKGISEVPNEIKDINLAEGLMLCQVQIAYIPKIIDAIKKN